MREPPRVGRTDARPWRWSADRLVVLLADSGFRTVNAGCLTFGFAALALALAVPLVVALGFLGVGRAWAEGWMLFTVFAVPALAGAGVVYLTQPRHVHPDVLVLDAHHVAARSRGTVVWEVTWRELVEVRLDGRVLVFERGEGPALRAPLLAHAWSDGRAEWLVGTLREVAARTRDAPPGEVDERLRVLLGRFVEVDAIPAIPEAPTADR